MLVPPPHIGKTRFTFNGFSANSPLALKYDIFSEDIVLQKDSYAHYISHTTLVSSVVVIVGAVL